MRYDAASWLASPEGAATVRDVAARLAGGEDVLRLATELRRRGMGADRAAAATGCAAAQLSTGRRLLGPPTALEQASHPQVAAWRARRFATAERVVDLCAGVGGDAVALAREAGSVVAVERDPARTVCLAGNAREADVAVDAVTGDALGPAVRTTGAVHADPSRRRGDRRARRLADYAPSVGALAARTSASSARAIVVSPAVDLSDPELPRGEVEFVQVGAGLVEAVVWSGDLAAATATATLLPAGLQRSRRGDPDRLPVGAIGGWLVEVAPAAVRARLHDSLGAEIGARRVAERRALLTADDRPPASPWWRARAVEAVLPPRGRAVRAWLRSADERPLEVAAHGVDIAPEAFWRAIGRPPRGPVGRRVDLVRLDDGAVAVVSVGPADVDG